MKESSIESRRWRFQKHFPEMFTFCLNSWRTLFISRLSSLIRCMRSTILTHMDLKSRRNCSEDFHDAYVRRTGSSELAGIAIVFRGSDSGFSAEVSHQIWQVTFDVILDWRTIEGSIQTRYLDRCWLFKGVRAKTAAGWVQPTARLRQ